MNFEEAKQKVANRAGFSDFEEYVEYSGWKFAAQVAFEFGCNEAVKADRDMIFGESYFDIEMNSQVVLIDATVAPLPFPAP